MERSHGSGLPPGPKVGEGQRKSQRTRGEPGNSKNRFSPSKARPAASGSAVLGLWEPREETES